MPILINDNYYKLLLSASLVHPKLKSIISPQDLDLDYTPDSKPPTPLSKYEN